MLFKEKKTAAYAQLEEQGSKFHAPTQEDGSKSVENATIRKSSSLLRIQCSKRHPTLWHGQGFTCCGLHNGPTPMFAFGFMIIRSWSWQTGRSLWISNYETLCIASSDFHFSARIIPQQTCAIWLSSLIEPLDLRKDL